MDFMMLHGVQNKFLEKYTNANNRKSFFSWNDKFYVELTQKYVSWELEAEFIFFSLWCLNLSLILSIRLWIFQYLCSYSIWCPKTCNSMHQATHFNCLSLSLLESCSPHAVIGFFLQMFPSYVSSVFSLFVLLFNLSYSLSHSLFLFPFAHPELIVFQVINISWL